MPSLTSGQTIFLVITTSLALICVLVSIWQLTRLKIKPYRSTLPVAAADRATVPDFAATTADALVPRGGVAATWHDQQADVFYDYEETAASSDTPPDFFIGADPGAVITIDDVHDHERQEELARYRRDYRAS